MVSQGLTLMIHHAILTEVILQWYSWYMQHSPNGIVVRIRVTQGLSVFLFFLTDLAEGH